MSTEPGAQVREFKEMVRALHAADIEVILDVVFNHTAEGNEQGPTLSFKGLENRVYYMLENGGQLYRNYTGCGNTLNGNHPGLRRLHRRNLRWWAGWLSWYDLLRYRRNHRCFLRQIARYDGRSYH